MRSREASRHHRRRTHSKRHGPRPRLVGPVAAEPKRALKVEAGAWENARNNKRAKADWQFAAADARVKLKRLAV